MPGRSLPAPHAKRSQSVHRTIWKEGQRRAGPQQANLEITLLIANILVIDQRLPMHKPKSPCDAGGCNWQLRLLLGYGVDLSRGIKRRGALPSTIGDAPEKLRSVDLQAPGGTALVLPAASSRDHRINQESLENFARPTGANAREHDAVNSDEPVNGCPLRWWIHRSCTDTTLVAKVDLCYKTTVGGRSAKAWQHASTPAEVCPPLNPPCDANRMRIPEAERNWVNESHRGSGAKHAPSSSLSGSP